MIFEELKLACKEIIEENDNCEFVRRLFENLSTHFLAHLIIDLINFLSRLSAKENSFREYLDALASIIKEIES